MGAGADAQDADAIDEYGIPIIPDPADAASRKRQAIIDAALAEFLAEGYSAASMDAITRGSGVSKATIYKHFGSKERLFLAVIGGVLPKTYADLEPANSTIADAPDLRAALVRLTTDWAGSCCAPTSCRCAAWSSARSTGSRSSDSSGTGSATT